MIDRFVDIDISENRLRNRGRVLEILLTDKTTGGNIIWATDSYHKPGKAHAPYLPKKPILREQITGKYGMTIQPRAAKTKHEQKMRTKDKAEVFTPLGVVKKMNMDINWASKNWPATKENWQDYIAELRLEITCGEAPFIAGRYNPTSNTRKIIETYRRVGFLDNKLQVVSEHTHTKKDWLKYAEIALKSSYGYEWQGDNLLIARENVLLTMDDFYAYFSKNKLKLKTKNTLSDEQLEHFAEIIAWNIFQMDGLKYVVPMSCKKSRLESEKSEKNQLSLLPSEKTKKQLIECEGCRLNNTTKHSGRYVKIMDWENNRTIKFVDLIKIPLAKSNTTRA